MRRWAPAVLIVVTLALSGLWYPRLPARVTPDWGALIPWAPPGEPMPRWFAAFWIPLLAAFVWLLLRALATRVAERLGRRVFPDWLLRDETGTAAVERFAPTYDAIVAAVVLGLLLFHFVLLGTLLGWPGWIAQGFTGLLGLGLFAIGNIMPRTRPNWVAGLRTAATLSDPAIWRRTHRWFGALLMVSGVAVIGASFRSAPYALLTAAGGVLSSALVATIAGRRPTGRRPDSLSSVALLALALAGTLEAQAPTYREEPFSVTSNGLVLPGTLTVPLATRGAVPIAVIIAGSGPTDRNGNGGGIHTDLYAQLAHALSERGIASLRYDKRGLGEAGRALDHAAFTLDDFVRDVMSAARAVGQDPRFSLVFLVGHSEGAGLALQAANRMPVAGVAMVSGTGRPLKDVVHEQFSRITDSLTVRRADTALARFLRGEEVTDIPDVARPLILPFYRKLIISMAQYDPPAEAARLAVPLLIVQAEMDLQVTLADAERLREANPRAAWLPIRGANHVYKLATSRDPAAQNPLYRDPALPIVNELPSGLSAWILGQKP